MTTEPSPKDDIAAFAEVQASLSDPFGDRDVTLALRGLDERAWQSIEAAWIARLAKDDDAAAVLAQAYGDAFESAKKAPGKQRGQKRSLAEAMAEATARPDLSASGSPSATASAPPEIVPTPDVAPAAFSAASPSASPAVKPLAIPSFLRDRKAESPGALVPPPAAPPAMEAPLATSPTPGYTGTAAVDIAAIFKSVVPFDPSAKESVPANPAPAAAPARDHAQQVFRGPSTASEAARLPASLSKSALSGETADVDIGAIARQVLAFGAARPAAPSTPSPSVASPPVASPPVASPPVASPPVVRPAAGSPPAASDRVVIRPAAAPVQAQNPTFTLDQYAQLSAEIAHDSDAAARSAVFARYGVQSSDALATEWRARFSADPALAGRWSAAYAHHSARLLGERGPRR